MAKSKYWDGANWVQTAPSMQEFNAIKDVLGAPEPSIAATLNAGWSNKPGLNGLSFFKDAFSIVHLSGVINRGSGGGDIITVLPVGYRPLSTLYPTVVVANPASTPRFGTTDTQLSTNGELLRGVNQYTDVYIDFSFRTI